MVEVTVTYRRADPQGGWQVKQRKFHGRDHYDTVEEAHAWIRRQRDIFNAEIDVRD